MRRSVLLLTFLAACGGSGQQAPVDDLGADGFGRDGDIGEWDAAETVAEVTQSDGLADGIPGDGAVGDTDHIGDTDLAGDVAPDLDTLDTELGDLDWEPCALIPGYEQSPEALCAVTTVPLYHEGDDGRTLPSWLMRYSAGGPVSAQMWMLQGGPGASGVAYGPTMARLAALYPGLELITLDHRGVGLSQRLGCPEQESAESDGGQAIVEAEWPACVDWLVQEWGDDLKAFSSMEAAKDVLLLARTLRREGVPVFVYGASYGTTLGHRILQTEGPDDQLAGVILDAPNWPTRTYDDYDTLWSAVGKAYFADCANDPVCAEHLGPDPVGRVEALWEKVDNGHCNMLESNSQSLKALLGWMLAYEVIRPFAVAIAYRIDRCSYSDVLAISSFYTAMFGENGLLRFDGDERFSEVLLNNILYSEDAPFGTLTIEELDAAMNGCFLCIGAGSGPVKAAATWPKYEFGAQYRQWAQTDTPVLFLAGEMDPFAPAFRLEESGVREAFNKAGQHVIAVPGGAHGALDHAPPADGSASCGEQILFQFLEEPTAEIDSACLDPISEPSYSLASEFVMSILNCPDLWDN